MKDVEFLGDALKRLRDFPDVARQEVGYQIHRLQTGQQPDDFKPMPTIGKGVEEIRVWEEGGTFRVIYTARLEDAVYVLHAFQKKAQETSQQDIGLAQARLKQLMQRK